VRYKLDETEKVLPDILSKGVGLSTPTMLKFFGGTTTLTTSVIYTKLSDGIQNELWIDYVNVKVNCNKFTVIVKQAFQQGYNILYNAT